MMEIFKSSLACQEQHKDSLVINFENSSDKCPSWIPHLGTRFKFTEKETLAQLFSCEFCKIFKNTFFA